MTVIDAEAARATNPETFRYGPTLPEHSEMLEKLLKEASLQELFEAFYLLTDIPVAIIDLNANVLISSHWRRICVQFHRVHPVSLERCIASDLFLGSELEKGAPFAIHGCGNGMTDCAAPIVIEGEHVANVFVGQFLTEPPDEAFFRRQAAELGFDEGEYLSALREVPVIERARIPRLLEVLAGFTRIVTRLAVDRKNALESQARLSAILNTIPQSVFWKDLEGRYLGCNAAFAAAAGLASPEQIVGKTDFEMPWRDAADAYRADDTGVIASRSPKLHLTEPLRRADGSHIIADTSKVPLIDAEGGTYGVLGIYEDITERRHAEQRLAESERKYRELVENANSIILRWSRDGTINFLNEFGLRFFGYTLDEVVGRNLVGILVPETESTGRDLSHLMEQIRADPKAVEQSLNENIKRNGERVWVSWTNKAVLDENGEVRELLAIGSDITDRRRAEQALADSERRFRTLIEDAPVAMSISRKAKTIYVNRKYVEMYGLRSADDAVGHSIGEQWAPEFREAIVDRARRRAKGESLPTEYEGVGLRADGSRIFVHVNVRSVILPDGSANMGFMQDVTDRRRAEEALRRSMVQSINAISSTLEARDPYTAGHQQRVAALAVAIGKEMGLDAERIEGLRFAASIHDLGKIRIPSEILAKPTKLTDIEAMMMRTHAEAGYQIMKDIEFPWPIAEIIRQHHERLDGSGYPRGLKGGDILLEAQILGVADVVEAMSSHRPYRPALGMEAALAEIERGRGTIYADAVVGACLKLIREDGISTS